MLTRRHSIVLTAKGLAALVASSPFFAACGQARNTSGVSSGEADASRGGAPAIEMDAGVGGPSAGRPVADASAGAVQDAPSAGSVEDANSGGMTQEDTQVPAEDIGPNSVEDVVEAAPEPLDWDTFIVELAALAQAQFSPTWDQESYVEDVAALMLLLDLDDAHFQTLYDGYVEVAGSFPELATVHEGGHFEVATLEFDAGDEIPLHNHPDMTGVIICLAGQTEVEGFNLLETLSDQGNLLLERVDQVTLTPGDHCTLTAERSNIHSLVATQFTQLFDVFTPPYDDEKLERYRWYQREMTPYEGEHIFEAWEA